ncbi:tape measure protein [Pseudomonas stutzeri]|uniref:tape measure protein n=1 Tax=Stutzerimonas stutzeri TaxID=316 RepID=UPI00210D2267|nr:tape measure protein [Stutzerimonas stutzeri]MCQ4311686.1 tape measure protein [Stutzerimonas stutzeri]
MAKRDVELIIRAKNEASSTVDAVSKSLAELEERQNTLGVSAKKTDGLLGELASEFDKLKAVSGSVQALTKLQQTAERAGEAFARQSAELAKSRDSYADLTRTQQMVARAGDSLQKEVEQSAAALAKEAQAAAATKAQLNEYAAAQRKATKASIAAEAALAKARNNYQEKPTPARETKLVDASLRTQQTKKAAQEAALAEAQLTAAYRTQNAALQSNRQAHSVLTKSLSEMERAETKLASEVRKTENAIAQQTAEISEAKGEYAALENVVERAEQTFRGAAAAQGVLGKSSQEVATQLTVLRARMQELQASQRTQTQAKPLIDPVALREANIGLRDAMTTIRTATNEATRGSVSLRELGNAVDQVSRSGQQLDGLLRAVQKQEAAVTGARQEWAAAQAEVKRLAGAVRSAAQPSEQLASALGRAQGQARAAKDAFIQESSAATQLGDSLRRAGLQNDGLADAQGRLKSRIADNNGILLRGRAALIGFEGASKRAGTGAKQAANGIGQIKTPAAGAATSLRDLVKSLGEVNSSGRTTLSLMQRLRGQMLSMAAATGGLYGIQDALGGVVRAQLEMDAVQSRLSVAFEGDQAKVQRALKFTEQTADELGLSFRTLSLQYSKLAAASLGTNLEGEKTEAIFRSMAEAARVLRLTDDEVAGSFKAMTDIMSKGTIQAEELKGQLGDRFPGAVQIMAKALGVGTAELAKMMEQGQLTSDKLYEFSQEMAKRVAPALAEAMESASAKIARLQNAVFETQLAIAKSGFLDELTEGVEYLTDSLNDPAVQEGFKKLGYYLGELIKLGVVLVENIDAVVAVLGTLLALKIAGTLASSLIGMGKAATTLYGALKLVSVQLGVMRAASIAATGGVSGMAAVLAAGAAKAGLYGLIAAEIYLIADAAYEAYKANEQLNRQTEKARAAQVTAAKELSEAEAKLNRLQQEGKGSLIVTQEKIALGAESIADKTRQAAAAYKAGTTAQNGYIRSSEELIKMTDEQVDAYQEVLLARMKVLTAVQQQGILNPDDEDAVDMAAKAEKEWHKLRVVLHETVAVEKERKAALGETAGAMAEVAETTEQATQKADDLKRRFDAVAKMNFDNTVLALEKVHDAKMAALVLSGADEQALLTATTQYESERLAIVRKFAQTQLDLVEQDTEKRRQILDRQKLTDEARAKELRSIEQEASKARIEIVQQEVQAVSSARDQALNRYMSSLQKVADLDRRIADLRMQGEFQIADIRRSAMTDVESYQNRQREITQLNSRIAQEAAKGNYEAAEALAQRQMSLAQSLNEEVKDGERVVVSKERASANAVQATKLANENLIKVLQQRKDLEHATAEQQRKLYESLTTALEKLNKTLAQLSGAKEIDIPLTIDEARAKAEMERAAAAMKASALKEKIGVPVIADTREYVAQFKSNVLSEDGTQITVGVFLEDGAYKLKVNEILDDTIVATAHVEMSGPDLQTAIARAREIIQGDLPKMQLAFDSAKTYAEYQSLTGEMQREIAQDSFVVTSQFEAETTEIDATVQRYSSQVTAAPVQFNPDASLINEARVAIAQPITVPVIFKSAGGDSFSQFPTADASAATGFAYGGYTGPGGKWKPAGVVHAGEHVQPQEVVREPGALEFLERIRRDGFQETMQDMQRRMRGYAMGGVVAQPKPAGLSPLAPASPAWATPVDRGTLSFHLPGGESFSLQTSGGNWDELSRAALKYSRPHRS